MDTLLACWQFVARKPPRPIGLVSLRFFQSENASFEPDVTAFRAAAPPQSRRQWPHGVNAPIAGCGLALQKCPSIAFQLGSRPSREGHLQKGVQFGPKTAHECDESFCHSDLTLPS